MQDRPTLRDTTQIGYGTATKASPLATNKVLRNTYFLLSLTLLFSAATAGASMAFNMPFINPVITLGVYFGLLFMTRKLRNSAAGIACVFALTGFMGLTLGPLLSFYMEQVSNGGQLVMTALGATGAVFVGLSAFAIQSRKDFSFMTGFITAGCIGLLAVIVLGLFIDLSVFQMAISAGVVLLMCALILWQTSDIIHGGETNYIMATVMLYVSIYNLFVNLLMLLGLGGDD
jgi:modulator of FtsH protease